jgi:guanylate kinase
MREVFGRCPLPLVRSISATTRPPRPDEVDGKDYHFITDEDFQLHRERGEFLECCPVFGNHHWYGTLRSEVEAGFLSGNWVVLVIDVQGASNVMEQYPEAVSIFIRPGSMEELERRLRGRGTETEETVRRRMARAALELAFAPKYRYQVNNDRVDRAAAEICEILKREWEKIGHD